MAQTELTRTLSDTAGWDSNFCCLEDRQSLCQAFYCGSFSSALITAWLSVHSTAVWCEDILVLAVSQILPCFSALHPQNWKGIIITLWTNMVLCSSLRNCHHLSLSPVSSLLHFFKRRINFKNINEGPTSSLIYIFHTTTRSWISNHPMSRFPIFFRGCFMRGLYVLTWPCNDMFPCSMLFRCYLCIL